MVLFYLKILGIEGILSGYLFTAENQRRLASGWFQGETFTLKLLETHPPPSVPLLTSRTL